MLVVVPFCNRDAWLTIQNLKWCRQLEGSTHFQCLLSYDISTDPTEVRDIASKYFAKVHELQYDEWTGTKLWPHAANWAWQAAARKVGQLKLGLPWLWWEADATPLCASWLEKLVQAYQEAAKPFLGRIFRHKGREYLHGVAVYPEDAYKYSYTAMLVQSVPFDIAAGPEFSTAAAETNLIGRFIDSRENADIFFRGKADLKRWLEPHWVLFHGCKNDSLIRTLAWQHKFTIFVKELPKSPKALVLAEPDSLQLVSDFAISPHANDPRPSIREQTPWPVKFIGFYGKPQGTRHFNASLIEGPQGLLLVSRRTRIVNRTLSSDLCVHLINPDLSKGQEIKPTIALLTGQQLEDPRVVFHVEHFYVSVCTWLHGQQYAAHQALLVFDSNWTHVDTLNIEFGGNGSQLLTNQYHEKNWTWFWHGSNWHILYQAYPHRVVQVSERRAEKEYRTRGLHWQFGQIRGGTPPILHEGQYYTFFHSSVPWRGPKRRYMMGAYTFQDHPPFRVLRYTPEPLLYGSEQDPRQFDPPLVVFPCGAVRQGEDWLVSMGVNDEECAIMRIPHKDLETRLHKF